MLLLIQSYLWSRAVPGAPRPCFNRSHIPYPCSFVLGAAPAANFSLEDAVTCNPGVNRYRPRSPFCPAPPPPGDLADRGCHRTSV